MMTGLDEDEDDGNDGDNDNGMVRMTTHAALTHSHALHF